MKVYAGIDLHSSNNYIGIINENDERLYQKRLPNQLVKDIGVRPTHLTNLHLFDSSQRAGGKI
jgi:hypothetical protein